MDILHKVEGVWSWEDSIKHNAVRIGDQIELELTDKVKGIFKATVQRVDKQGVLFMFDDCICELPGKFINGYAINELSDEVELEIPTFGMIFGHDHPRYQEFSQDNDEQLLLMKDIRNRIGVYKDRLETYWLKNRLSAGSIKGPFLKDPAVRYACVYDGIAACENEVLHNGIRPVFTIRNDCYGLKPLETD